MGETVGYSVKLRRRFSSCTRILYCTVGVFLRKLVGPLSTNELLSQPTYVILDEVHERDLDTDFSLAILRNLLPMFPSIKLILMSATSQSQLFLKYFSCDEIHPKLLNVPGKIFPVEVKWLDECERVTRRHMEGSDIDQNSSRNDTNMFNSIETQMLSNRCLSKIDNEFICELVKYIVSVKDDDGHILIFLPGVGEIETLFRKMRDIPAIANENKFLLLKLYSSLRDHSKVFVSPPKGLRKIILSTNCAETSVTIQGITNVIDLGRVKECRFDATKRLSELVPVRVSQASALQRCGRAGRTQKGVCWRLYRKETFEDCMIHHTTPEILVTSLEEVLLRACLVEEFQMLTEESGLPITALGLLRSLPESPNKTKVEGACMHLFQIGALTNMSKPLLTPLGWHLAHLPMDASLGKMLLVSVLLGCLEPVAVIVAALLSTKSIFLNNNSEQCRQSHEKLIKEGFGGAHWKNGTVKGDLIAVAAAYFKWEKHEDRNERRKFVKSHFLDFDAISEITRLRSQIKDSLNQAGFLADKESTMYANANNDNALFVSCCIVAGLYPNVATLVRKVPGARNRRPKLLTKDGDLCFPSSSSFQRDRVRNAKSEGHDTYAVYLSKFCIVHTTDSDDRNQKSITLTDVNFISRYSVLLFGGNLEMKGNSIICDDWLKFKLDGDCSKYSAHLIHALREELDSILLKQICVDATENRFRLDQSVEVIKFVGRLISEE